MHIFDVDEPTKSPIRLTIPLPFPPSDTETYPWLAGGDRYYLLEENIGPGGFSIAYRGHPCDTGGVPVFGTEPVVIKVPNLGDDRTSGDVGRRLEYIRQQSLIEWAHLRNRLLNCKHANPIFDMGDVWTNQSPPIQMFVTVQPFLSGAVPLKQWLVDEHLRSRIAYDDDDGEIPWTGLNQWEDWLKIVMIVGEGLVEIHRCRVIHGDIWPSNIYISKSSPEYAVFIDFGEAFAVTPTGDPRTQRDHPYRAPEREKAEYVPTEQVDVYSFGKLMLYLAIGRDQKIDPRDQDGVLYGHRRRNFVRKLLFEYNRPLISRHPEILDVISECTAMDPVDRPTMQEVCDQLRTWAAPSAVAPIELSAKLEKIAANSKTNFLKPSSVFMRFLDRKVEELERLVDSSQTEMVEIRGTRHALISALAGLFGDLKEGDSWTALTTPSVWQRSGLGLDGRYATATITAVRRGASVQRAYAISVEELGAKWSEAFSQKLVDSKDDNLVRLGKLFKKAVHDFESDSLAEDFKTRDSHFLETHQRRFVCVLESLKNMLDLWDLGSRLCTENFAGIENTEGLYLGLAPVATLAKIRERRSQNPVSLMHMRDGKRTEGEWLLVMTDIRGRNEYESVTTGSPQLFGVRVYKSVMGYPKDRVLHLEGFFKNYSVNVGPSAERLFECACAVPFSSEAGGRQP